MESDYSDTRMHLEETDCHQSVDMTVEPVCSDAIEQTEDHYQCDDIAVLPVHTDTMSHLEETNEQNDDDTTTQQVYSSASIVFIETEDGQPDYSDSTDNIDICETVEVEVSNHVESETVPDILNVQVPESSSMDVEVNERIEMDDNVDMEMIVEEQFVEEIESVEILEEGKLSRMDVYAESGSMSVYTDIPSSETAVEEYAEEDLSDEYVQEQAEPSLNVNVDTHFTSSTVISSAMTAESFHAEQDHTSLSVSEKCEGTNIAGKCSSEPDPGCTFSNLEGTDGTAEETCTSQDTDREECIITSDKTDTDQVTDLNKERLTTKENFPATREDMSQSETLLDNACVLKMADQASSPQSSQHSEPQSKNQLSVLPQTDHLRPEVSHNMETESCAAESCATEAGKESENVVTAVFCQLSEDSQRVSTDAETNNTKNNVDITSGGCGADTELLSGKETADRQMDRNNEDRTDTSITHLPGRSPFQTDMRASSPSQGAHNSNDNEEIVCTSETVESLETDNRLQVVSERSYKSKKKTKHFSKTQKGADEENVLTVFQSQAERSETATEKREVTGQDLDQTHPAEDTFNTGQVFASDTDFAEHQAETIVPVSEACVNEHKEEDTREIENTIEHFETACVKAKGANSPDRKMVSEQTVQNSNVEEQRAESGKENTRVGGKRAKMTRNEVDVCSAEDGEKQQACTGMECIPDQTNTDENVFPKTKHVDSSQEKESHAESERDCSNAVVTKMVDIEGPETEILAEMGSIAAQETDTKITAAKRKSVAKVNTKTTNAVTNQENDNLEEMETAKTLVSLSVLAQNRKYMSHLSTEVSLVSSQGSHISSFHEVSVIDQTSVPTNMTNEISTARGEQAEDVEQKAETDGITETKTREFEMVTEQKAAQRSITEEGRKTVEMVNKASRKAEPQIEHTKFLVSTNCTAEEEMKSVGAAEENASIKKHPLNIPDGGAEKENRWMCTETGTINPSQENQNVCLEQVDNERMESMNLTNKEEGGSTSDRFNEQACPSTSRHFTKSLDNISFGEDLSTTENHEPRDRTQVLSKKTDLMTKTDNKPVDDTCQKRVDGNNQKINTNNKEIEMHGQSVTSAEYDEELRSSVQQLVQLMNGACTEKPREIYEETLEDSCNTDRSVSSLEKMLVTIQKMTVDSSVTRAMKSTMRFPQLTWTRTLRMEKITKSMVSVH